MRSEKPLPTHANLEVGPHLNDDQLMEAYVLAHENRHLASCDQCQTRFDAMAESLQHAVDSAVREADAIFTPEKLHEQRDRIMRRIERHDHPAEVVRFPSRSAGHPAVRRVLGPARRWVAGAAAAGLAAGMFLGFTMDRRMHYEALDQALKQSAAQASVAWRAADQREQDFFVEIEDVLMGTRAIELRAIDAMTTPVEIREASYPR
jgi:predicted anti-sigma-YlaC factor YlaD